MADKKFTDFEVGDLVKRYSVNKDPNDVDEMGVIVATLWDGIPFIKVYWQYDHTFTYFSIYVASERLIVCSRES